MAIINRITDICREKGIQQQTICKAIGITSGTFSTWKKRGTDPEAKYLPCICEILGVSMEYLLTGDEGMTYASKESAEPRAPELQQYTWTFPEDTETDKLYNKVCYALYMLHGSLKASAMLSAVELPSDKPADISETALKWLAYKSGTDFTFFTVGAYEAGKSDFNTVESYASECERLSPDVPYSSEDWADKREEYPEMKKWDENYSYFIKKTVEKSINQEYFLEIAEKFAQYSRNQADLMMYIKQGIALYEADRRNRGNRRNAEMTARHEGLA